MATILVIDDDPVILEFYNELLMRAGHEVVTAEDGIQGLARSEHRPELIVVDLMMPNLNGYDFVRQLRTTEGHRTTPVIAVSGLSTGEWVLRSGANRFLAKPVRSHQLIAMIDDLLDGGEPGA